MPVQVDVDGLLRGLHDRCSGPVTFAVRASDPAQDLVSLFEQVRTAIAAANNAAVHREPNDPTWATEGDLAGTEVRAEIAKGLFTDSEVRAWFGDFERALPDVATDLMVVPSVPDPALPDFDEWIEMPPSLTAFLSFVPVMDGRLRTVPAHVAEETADELAAWCRLPGALTVMQRGFSDFVVPPASTAEELRLGARLDPQFGVVSVIGDPRRARTVTFDVQGKGNVQVVDTVRPPTSSLDDLLTPLRILAPYVEYGWVRRAITLSPSEQDISFMLGRQSTPIEDAAPSRPDLLDRYVIDAHVAQLLTSAHLSRIGSLDSYELEELGNNRFLAVARDPEPWVAGLNPDPDVLERARAEFADALLTPETIKNTPRRP